MKGPKFHFQNVSKNKETRENSNAEQLSLLLLLHGLIKVLHRYNDELSVACSQTLSEPSVVSKQLTRLEFRT